jgi:hypothetical protein
MLSWKTYEDQARLSVILAILSMLAGLAAVGLILRNLDAELFFVNFRKSGLFLPIMGLGLLVALGAGAGGFFLGLHTAGQSRNKATNLSWLGFFGSAASLTIALSAGVFFFFTRNAIG